MISQKDMAHHNIIMIALIFLLYSFLINQGMRLFRQLSLKLWNLLPSNTQILPVQI